MVERKLEAGPSKRFFVEMLPRDISLEHAVLDLVDNSLDGAIRERISEIRGRNAKPYAGLQCALEISGDHFRISDNCGGIPDNRLDAALRLGRDDISIDDDKPTIGMYGIGMKRSIFKISQDATVVSKSATSTVTVRYDEEWLDPDNPDWTLTLQQEPPSPGEPGVSITANKIWPNISRIFRSTSFHDDLARALSRYYAYVIEKGFSITLNGHEIQPLPVEFRFEDNISPFYFETTNGKTKVRVIVGLFRKLTREDERESQTMSPDKAEIGSLKAGITVICNDRVIKYADTTATTGWGMGNVPRYHPQFRSIAGAIIFESDDARTLPVSTTKGDLEIDDAVYVLGLNAAMEGLRALTQFTNQFKGIEAVTDDLIATAKRASISEVTNRLSAVARADRKAGGSARKAPARLPQPEKRNPMVHMAFRRERSEVEEVANLLGMSTIDRPSVVAEQVWTDRLRSLGIIK
ncbi:ATP-binding protein [Rhodovulum sulfidophilum]|uniref:ATP-binding protein n=1 Tax=Rhodovulum sulfidophilum TaxID=35806 RepID=UPI001923FED5|nr:ATP-binding protein [Rhodovulum sulfidophilum]MBL3594829.1 ATP-binding protein [Rhodovulum sulfidophilum]